MLLHPYLLIGRLRLCSCMFLFSYSVSIMLKSIERKGAMSVTGVRVS